MNDEVGDPLVEGSVFASDQAWCQGMRTGEGGTLTFGAGVVELGAVLVARRVDAPSVLLVQKAARAGYEWSGRWALPGGMLRGQDLHSVGVEDLEALARAAMARRVAVEVGVPLHGVGSARPLGLIPPPVTHYHLKAKSCYVLVLPFVLEGVEALPTQSDDPSIATARWREPVEAWGELTPATSLILGHLLWRELGATGRASVEPLLRDALAVCRGWAAEVGLPPVPAPWDA